MKNECKKLYKQRKIERSNKRAKEEALSKDRKTFWPEIAKYEIEIQTAEKSRQNKGGCAQLTNR